MEVRSPDPSSNPYLLISLLLSAGFEGIADGAVPQIEAAGDMISLSSGVKLPSSLAAAVDAAGKSSFIRSVIPPGIVEGYLEDRQAEADEYGQGLSDYDSMIRRFLRFI